MSSVTYSPKDVTITVRGEPLVEWDGPHSHAGSSGLNATFAVQLTRAGHRRWLDFALGRRPRRSKGWRKHVRRMKAEKRRQGRAL